MSATNASILTFDAAAIISRWHTNPKAQWRQAQNVARFITFFIILTADLSASFTIRTYNLDSHRQKLLSGEVER